MALREALWENHEEIARLVTEDMGKTLDDARGEVAARNRVDRGRERRSRTCSRARTSRASRAGSTSSSCASRSASSAAITPFNFPAMIPLWFLPFAIACGNTFILKPSERDPRPSERIFELIDEIEEIPAGVLQPRPRRA